MRVIFSQWDFASPRRSRNENSSVMAASSPYLTPAPILSRLASNLAQNKSCVRPKWRACSQANTDLDYFTYLFFRTVKKCTKIYKAHAQLLFWSLNFVFADVQVVMVYLISLVLPKPQLAYMQM